MATAAEKFHQQAMQLITQNKWQEALVALQQAVKADNTNPAYLHDLARVYAHLTDFQAAKQHYQEALARHPHYAEAHHNLAVLYERQHDYPQALRHYAKALHAKPDYLQAHTHLASLLIKMGKLKEAVKQYRNVVGLCPGDYHAHYQLATVYLQLEDLGLAEKHYKWVLKQHPEHLETLNNLGVLALKRGHAQLSIEYFSQVLALDNDHVDARSNIAATFLQHDRYENALRHYRVLEGLTPDDMDMHFNMGVALMALGEWQEATVHYQQVLQAFSEHVPALTNLGGIYMRLRQTTKAIQCFEKALALAPHDQSLQYMLAAIRGGASPKRAPQDYVHHLFDNYAINFEHHLLKRLNYQLPQQFQKALKVVTGQDEATWRILDLGCGTGLSGQAISAYAKELVGVDLSEKMLALAREKTVYDDLHREDIQHFLDQQPACYDVIVAMDVLGYFGDLLPVLRACRQALKAEGLLAFSVEKSDSEDYQLQPTARFAHSLAYLKQLAEALHFSIVYQQTVRARIQEDKPLMVDLCIFQVMSARIT